MGYTKYIFPFLFTYSLVLGIPDPPPDCSRTDLNLWELYICELKDSTQPQCIPTRRVPTTTNIIGLVSLFHGYTACPDSFDPLAERLQAAGYVVLSFLTVGHGRTFGDCGEGTECVDDEYPVENLPTNRSGYIGFINIANTIVEQQIQLLSLSRDQHVIAAAGLSLGGPLATVAVAKGNDLYTHMILFNPFYGITDPSSDRQVAHCANLPSKCIMDFIEGVISATTSQLFGENNQTQSDEPQLFLFNLVNSSNLNLFGTTQILGGYAQLQSALRFGITVLIENESHLPESIREILNMSMGWGDECIQAKKERNRGGYCSFKIKHLFAVHSFATYALSMVRRIVKLNKAQFVTVERDGISRNGMTYSSLNTISSNADLSGLCMYRLVDGCVLTGDNECGVPHSMASRSEQLGNAPFYLYWEENYISSTIRWLSNNNTIGEAYFLNNRSVCVIADAPDPFLFGVIPVPVEIILRNILDSVVKDIVQNFVFLALQNLFESVQSEGEESFLFEPLQIISDWEKIRLILHVSQTFASIFENQVKVGDLSTLAGAPIVSIQTEDDYIILPPNATSSPSSTYLLSLPNLYTLFCCLISVRIFQVHA